MFCTRCGKENADDARFCQSCGSAFAVETRDLASLPPAVAAPASETRAVYAGFWKRVAAFIIDWAILVFTPAFGLGLVVGFAEGLMRRPAIDKATMDQLGTIAVLIGLVFAWPYSALLESSSMQATLGKLALGIKVTDLQGNRLKLRQANGRFFAKVLSALVIGIGFFVIAWTRKKQGLHDYLAGTLVLVR